MQKNRVKSVATSVTLVIFNATSGFCQVPGVPSTGSTTPASTSSNILSGHVKADVVTAEKLLSQGKWTDAEGMFRDALVSNPADVQATLGLGLALVNQFKLDGADSLFDRVISLDPNNPTAFAGKAATILGRLQSSSGSIRANRDLLLKQAESYATKATTFGPAIAETHLSLGQVLREEGRNDEAAAELGTALRLDPQLSYAYSTLGSIRIEQNNLIEAASSFQQAIDLNSGNSSAHYGLGAVLLKQNQVDGAIKELNISLSQFPNSWPTRMALGQAYQKQGNIVAALQQYQLSTLIKPENAQPYLSMADIHQERGDEELALADLRSGLSQSPYDLNLRQRIADIELKLERPDEAIKGYRTILQVSANDNNAVKGLSQALFLKAQRATVGAMLQSNDFDTASRALDEAIKLNPTDMELRLAREKLYSLSNTVPSVSMMAEPTNDGDRISYAESAIATGNFTKATAQLDAVTANQKDPKQTYAVADIAVMIKALDNAEAAFKKGLAQGGSPDRADRGLKQIAQLRQKAVDDTKIAGELARKKQWDGAISKYREAIAANPLYADARYGIAEALDDGPKDSVATLGESAHQYQLYLVLATNLNQKDRAKITETIGKLNEKVAKLQEREAKEEKDRARDKD